MLKVRDIFDIAVVDNIEGDALRQNLHRVTRLKPQITARLDSISEDFCRDELAELDISNRWQAVADTCLQRVRQMLGNIKDA